MIAHRFPPTLRIASMIRFAPVRSLIRRAGFALATAVVLIQNIDAPRALAANLPAGFSETVITGPNSGQWNEAVGVTFDSAGRIFVWERLGRVWFKDPGDPSFTLLLDISDEVGAWVDYGLVGFAVDPNFRVNGNVYLLYVVDRHHLFFFGTPGYNPATNHYQEATIGRLTRYTCTASNDFRTINPSSRFILIGETKETGFPLCSDTHGPGSLAFGNDGTLLVSAGDGASAWTYDSGNNAFGSFAPQALADGILKPKENIGAFRAQLPDCLSGKILRIDPATGDGVPSNPFYDPGAPRAPRSRVWTLGLRNPFRISVRPDSGSHDPADGNPGVIYVGIVGWDLWESLAVVKGPKQNFGWPMYEGMSPLAGYNLGTLNQDAPNPLFPGAGCNQFFAFRDLFKPATTNAAAFPPFTNPCNPAVTIPASIPQFIQSRPALDWHHTLNQTLTPVFTASGQGIATNIGVPGSPVSGTQFSGNCSIAGVWYTASDFPVQYQNKFFLADWDRGWMKTVAFDTNNNPTAVADFLTAGGRITCMTEHPFDGSLYYVSYDYDAAGTVRRIAYTGNRTPVAVATANTNFGPGPLNVQFSSAGSFDPDGSPLTYSWNFGDGTPASPLANPSHIFNAPPGVATNYTVTLTVTDPGGLFSQRTLLIVLNDTPPVVEISSPANGALYSMSGSTLYNLTATVTDAESPDGQLSYRWQTLLRHNEHSHLLFTDTNHTSSVSLSPIGCDGVNIYHYRIVLTVTDPTGLSTTHEVRVFPDCGSPDSPPTISDVANQSVFQDQSTPPLAFTVGDAQVAAANLHVTGSSSNPQLVPNGNIVFGGSQSNRTVTVTPAPGQTGATTITLTVNDGPFNVNDTFQLTVNPPPPGTRSFTNSTSIPIPSSGPANPYPSIINVGGIGGVVSNVTVTLRNLTHSWCSDIDVLLVNPSGLGVLLMSDAGNAFAPNNLTFTLSDAAAGSLPANGAFTAGTYKPTDHAPADSFTAPAPAGPYGTMLSNFIGSTASGAWGLYVIDDGAGDLGNLAGGWSITVTTMSSSGAIPTISDIPDQLTIVNVPTPALPFTIGDADTPLNELVLTRASSNTTLVPTNNIVFGGSLSNRTVTVTPAAGQTGSAIISIGVSDGTNSAGDTFILTVEAENTPPTISAISDQVIDEDTSTGPIPFTVGDGETAPDSLLLSRASSNQSLVPTNNIVFGGSGANRTVTITPATNASGSAIITVSVRDGFYTTPTNFLVTVDPVNDPPFVSSIADQIINVNGSTGPIPFTISDVESAAASLGLAKGSSNPTLVPTNNIVFGGSGANRTVTVTPSPALTGSSTISVEVTDGEAITTRNFVLTVSSLFVGSRSFTNSTGIPIPDQGASSLYPSTIAVTGMGGVITNMTVTLRNLSHTWASDIDVLLVGPGGQKSIVMSDAGSGNAPNVTLTLSNNAASLLPPSALASGTFRPTDYNDASPGGDNYPGPAPSGPHTNSFAVFNGTGPNGTWSLYVFDDGPGDLGSFAGGWVLTLTTVSSGFDSNTPPVISAITNQIVPWNSVIGPLGFTVSDAETAAVNLMLNSASSNTVLAPTNNIVFGGSGTNRTVTITPATDESGTAFITIGVSDGDLTATTGFLITVQAPATPPLISAELINEQTIRLTITGDAGRTIALLGSEDMIEWTEIDTDGNETGTIFFDQQLQQPGYFYRAVVLP